MRNRSSAAVQVLYVLELPVLRAGAAAGAGAAALVPLKISAQENDS